MPSVQPPVQFRNAFTAIITPFSADGTSIDFGRLREQIQFQAAGQITGVVLAGTTGESPTLSSGEWHELIQRGVTFAHDAGILAVAGTGSNNTAHAVELQVEAARLGADATLSVNPYYNKPVQEGLYRHFMAQADSAAIPTILYNIPGRTGALLQPETVERLARHPNIKAIKEATGSCDSAGEIAARCPGLALLSGDDALTLPFASLGGVGVVSVISNLLPRETGDLCRACNAGNWARALEIHRSMLGLIKALFVETNPIPIKAAMKLLGRDSGVTRLPMTEASASTIAALQKAIATWPTLTAPGTTVPGTTTPRPVSAAAR
jgi:4-hydroxy-tetrahydrodipicolinate synthase